MMLSKNSLVLVLCSVLGGIECLTAQTGGIGDPGTAPGTPSQSYALSSLDNVNYYNGHVNISIPIRTLGAAGRGTAARTSVLGIDREWTVDNVSGSYSPDTSLQPYGASVYALGSLSIEATSANPYACPTYSNGTVSYLGLGPFTTTITWLTGNGTEKVLYDVALNGQQQGASITDCSQAANYRQADRGRVFRSADGTDTIFVADSDVYDGGSSGVAPPGVLILRDGTKFRFGADSYMTSVEDRNGNRLNVSFSSTSNGGIYAVSDSLNRSEDINFTECLNGCYAAPDTVDAFQYHGSGGAGRETDVNYALLSNALAPGESVQSYQSLFPELNGSSSSNFNPYVVSSVILPDGNRYTMQYNAYGEVARLTLPTGGYYNYRYPEAPANTGSGVIGLSNGSYKILRRLLERDEYSDGVNLSAKMLFDYSSYPSNLDANHPSRPGSVTQVGIDNNSGQLMKREQHYYYGDPASTQAPPQDQTQYAEWWRGLEFFSYVADNSGVLREKNTVYGQRPCAAGDNCWIDPQSETAPARDPQVCQINTTESDGSVSSIVMGYDQQNNMTDKYEYDFGSAPAIGAGCPGAPDGWTRYTAMLFRSDAQYLDPNIHLVALPQARRIYNDSNQAVAYSVWGYDEYSQQPLQDAPGIVGHDPSYSTSFQTRGNNTSYQQAEDGTNLSIGVRNSFDIGGNVVQFLDGNAHPTSYEYNGDGLNYYAFPTKTTNALNEASTAAYDYSIGKASSTADLHGTLTYYDHAPSEPLDRVTAIRVVSGSTTLQQTTFAYPNAQTVNTNSDLNTAGDGVLQTSSITDGLGRPYLDRTYESANQYIETYTGFDALGRISAKSNPSRPGDGLNLLTSYSYDALDRLTATLQPDGSVSTTTYAGPTATVTDEAGKSKQLTYDGLGHLDYIQEGAQDSDNFTFYGYDALDNLTFAGVFAQSRHFSYDGLGRLLSSWNPESSTINYTYDAVGNVKTKQDSRGIQTTYTYDAINRLLSKTSSDGSLNTSLNYADGSRQFSVGSPASTSYYAYDLQGHITASTQATAGTAYSFTYTYNAAGLLTSETYPSGRVVSTGYDGAGRAAWLQGNWGGALTNYVSTPGDANTWVHYWPHGGIYYYIRGNTVWHAASFNKQLRQTESYEALNNDQGKMLFVACPDWGENSNNGVYPLCSTNAGTQNNGNLQNYSESYGGPGYPSPLNFSQSFSYDPLNRLSSITDSGGYSRSFAYDPYGNMSVSAATGISLSPLTPYSGDGSNPFDGQSHLKSGTYDNAGNQTVLGSLQISYDADNHQISVQDGPYAPYTYAYDGNGQRILKSIPDVGRTVYVHDAFGLLAAEYSEAGEPSPCQTCYLGVDHLGSTRLVTDGTGAVVGRHDYMPFGEEVWANMAGRDGSFSTPDDIDPKFTGQSRDGETQLDWFQTRYYKGALGRFMSPDPGQAGADPLYPQSWNAYSYVRNNPLSSIDFNGQDSGDPCNGNPNCVTVSAGYEGISIIDQFIYQASSTMLNFSQQAQQLAQPILQPIQHGLDYLSQPRDPNCVMGSIASGGAIGTGTGIVLGGIAGIETGPGAVGTAYAGGLIGGPAGSFAGNVAGLVSCMSSNGGTGGGGASRGSGDDARLTRPQQRQTAEHLGMKEVKGLTSQGQPVFTKDGRYFSFSNTSHTAGEVFKEVDRNGNRLATTDLNFNRIGQ